MLHKIGKYGKEIGENYQQSGKIINKIGEIGTLNPPLSNGIFLANLSQGSFAQVIYNFP